MKEQPGYSSDSDMVVEYALEINEQPVYVEFPIDLTELAKSCQFSGELNIYTCGCGVPDCAGIYKGIEVGHSVDAITWICPEPLAIKYDSPATHEDKVNDSRNFRFEPDQYINTIDSGIKRIKSLAVSADGPVCFQVYGLKLNDVLALDAKVFSTHYLGSERRLVAKQIVVNAYHGFITANGMYFKIQDLCLPDELIAMYRAFAAKCEYPQTETEIPRYEDYLQAGRAFCQALRKFLCKETTVFFSYKPPEVYNNFAWEVTEEIR